MKLWVAVLCVLAIMLLAGVMLAHKLVEKMFVWN